MTDQVEFADIIILNKTDLITPFQLGELKAIIKSLNPVAKIIESSFSKVNPNEIINTGLFDYEKAEQSAGWIQELANRENGMAHNPETLEYGIGSFVFRDKRPFHPERFWNYLTENWHAGIIRSKGLFWIASRPDEALNWSQAGGSLRAEGAGVWWASMPFNERTRYGSFVENQKEIESKWDKRFGDRQNELVIIGQDLNEGVIRFELEECLCTEEEIRRMEQKGSFKDPFPASM